MTMYKLELLTSRRSCKQDIIHKMVWVELRFSEDVDYLLRYAAQKIDEAQSREEGKYKMDKSNTYLVKGLDSLVIGRGHVWTLYHGDSYDDKKFKLQVTLEPLVEKQGYHYHD